MVRNVNRVPKKQWSKWSDDARRVFNYVYEVMVDNQYLFLHPKQEAPKPVFWKTTGWNAAWLAADAVDSTAAPGAATPSEAV